MITTALLGRLPDSLKKVRTCVYSLTEMMSLTMIGFTEQHQFIAVLIFLVCLISYHQGFLSDDVIEKLGVERRGERKGLFSDRESASDVHRQWDKEARAMEQSHKYDLKEQRKQLEQEYEQKLKDIHRQWAEEVDAITKSKDYDRREDMKQ